MGNIIINGRKYQGSCVTVVNGKTYIDGKPADNVTQSNETPTHIVIEGDVETLKTDLSVQVNGRVGSIEAGGSVSCDNVTGNVHSGGSVSCDKN